MKRVFVAILAVCLLFGGFIAYKQFGKTEREEIQFEPIETDETSQVDIDRVDWDAIYLLHDPDEVVVKINNEEITWAEYYYWFISYGQSIENYIEQTAQYNDEAYTWEDCLGDDVPLKDEPAAYAQKIIEQYSATYEYGNRNNLTLNSDSLKNVQAQIEDNIISLCGEDATIEDLYKQLDAMHMPRELFEKMINGNVLYSQMCTDIYGEEGSKLSDMEVQDELDADQYYRMMHILFATTNENYEELSDSEKESLKVKAELLSDELNKITDKEARAAKFKEYMNQHTEDPGVATFPNGYTFTLGTMFTEIEEVLCTMDKYEVSGVIESSAGYHIIIRLPIDPEEIIYEYYANGEIITARKFVAEKKFDAAISKLIHESDFELVNGFEIPIITDYII